MKDDGGGSAGAAGLPVDTLPTSLNEGRGNWQALSQRRASVVSIGRLAAGTPHRRALA